MHKKNEKFISLLRLFGYMKSYRMRLITSTIATILHNVFDVLPDILIGIAVDIVVNKQNSFIARLGISDVMTQLSILAGLVFIVWTSEAVCQYMSQVGWMKIAQLVQHDLRIEAYAHMQSLEISYFEDKSAGEILTVLNDDINQLEYFFDKVIIDSLYFFVNVAMVGYVFLYLSPAVAFFAFLPVPIILLITHKFQHRLGLLYMTMRECAGFLCSRISTNIFGIATIKSCTTESYEIERVRHDSDAYKKSSSAAVEVSAAFVPVVRVTVACGFVVTIVLGGWYTLHGVLAVGSYSVLVSMTQRLLWPFIYLAKITDVYKRTMACAQRIFTILDIPVGIYDGHYEPLTATIKGKIEFKNVSFSYPSGRAIFSNLSLSIEPGQTVGFVGSTGSGKTTLIKLLLRFYDLERGSILLDGVMTKDFKLDVLRQAFGVVTQDVFLFKGTIKENIAYGSPDVTDQEIEYAAHVAEIHDFIMSLPEGYNTIVGEHGQRLSGGQRQRISIARAIVNKPPILIFDEATSSVDNETEAAIQRSLEKIAKDHTVFVIAHRLSSVRNADTIFVLHNGVMVEAGKHDDLVVQNGAYAKLWNIQTGQ